MTRYRTKPVRFWIANVLLAPLAGAVIALVLNFALFQFFFDGAQVLLLATGFGFAMVTGFFTSGYVFGFVAVTLYAAGLTLWQMRRGGHTPLDALLIAWSAVALVGAGYALFVPHERILGWFVVSAAIALPLMWFVCLWSGITYRLKSTEAAIEASAA